MSTWNPDLMLHIQHLEPQILNYRMNYFVYFGNMVKGLPCCKVDKVAHPVIQDIWLQMLYAKHQARIPSRHCSLLK